MSELLDYDEHVTVEPADLAHTLRVLADREGTTWTSHPELVTALVTGQPIAVPALLLWRLTHIADPALVYDLDEADPATYDRPDVQADLRLEAALFRQAPRTAAAMMAVADAELAIIAAGHKENE